jgi:hypothetical protein
MNLDDLWIGDRIRIKSTGVVGRYHGQKSGRPQIQTAEGIVETDAQDIEPIDEEPLEKHAEIKAVPPEIDLKAISKFNAILDLHHDALLKSGHLPPEGPILEWQLLTCQKFISKAHSLQVRRVSIIHGIGAGILKNQVAHLLDQNPDVSDFEPSFDGASFIVYLV